MLGILRIVECRRSAEIEMGHAPESGGYGQSEVPGTLRLQPPACPQHPVPGNCPLSVLFIHSPASDRIPPPARWARRLSPSPGGISPSAMARYSPAHGQDPFLSGPGLPAPSASFFIAAACPLASFSLSPVTVLFSRNVFSAVMAASIPPLTMCFATIVSPRYPDPAD